MKKSQSQMAFNIAFNHFPGANGPRREREELRRSASRDLRDQVRARLRAAGRLHRHSLQQEQPRGASSFRKGNGKALEDFAQQKTL
jgi:hypothetical protein